METRTGLLAIFLIALAFAFIPSASAQTGINDTEETNITVTISSTTMIDIAPASFSYTAEPGEACGRYLSNELCNESVNDFYALQVENIGSWNISEIWFNVSQPTQSPFATGNNTYVDPGNFVQLTWNDTSDDWFYVDRKEFPEAKTIVYLRDPAGTMPANLSAYHYGRFRNASREYFYMLQNTTAGTCEAAETGYIRIGVNPRSTTALGSTDFTDGGDVTNYYQINLTTDTTYAVGNISVGPLAGYAVAVEETTCIVRFSRWNIDHPFDFAGSPAISSFSGALTPGDSVSKRVGVLVDYGIYAGQKTGLLTAVATGQ